MRTNDEEINEKVKDLASGVKGKKNKLNKFMNELNLQNPEFQSLITQIEKTTRETKYKWNVIIDVPIKFNNEEKKIEKLRLHCKYDYFEECQIWSPLSCQKPDYCISFTCLQAYFRNKYFDNLLTLDYEKMRQFIQFYLNE
jgi:hypothetical protein